MLVFIAITQKLAQALLVKYNGSSYVYVDYTGFTDSYSTTINPTYYGDDVKDISTNIPFPGKFNYSFSCNANPVLSYGGKAKMEIYNQGGSKIYTSNDTSLGTGNPFTFSYNNVTGTTLETVKLYMQKYNSGTSAVTTTLTITSTQKGIIKSPKNGVKGKPRELKVISEKANTTILGIHIDNSRVNH